MGHHLETEKRGCLETKDPLRPLKTQRPPFFWLGYCFSQYPREKSSPPEKWFFFLRGEFETRLKHWLNHIPGSRRAKSGSSSEISSGSYVVSFLSRCENFFDTRLSKGTLISWLGLSIKRFSMVNVWDEVFVSKFWGLRGLGLTLYAKT